MSFTTRRTAVLTAVVLLCTLAACGGDDDDEAPSGASTTTTEDQGNDITTTDDDTVTVTNEPTTPPPPDESVPSSGSGDIGCDGVNTWNQEAEADRFPALRANDALYRVIPDRGDVCEELRFVLNGPGPAGYQVEYMTPGEASEGVVEVAGNGTLVVRLNAPIHGVNSSDGHQGNPAPPQLEFAPDHFNGWSSLRELKLTSQDNAIVWAVGLRERLSFRVYIDPGDNASYWTLVVQVAR